MPKLKLNLAPKRERGMLAALYDVFLFHLMDEEQLTST